MRQRAKLTSKQEQLLLEQEITHQQPGAILQDFGLVLDFVGTEGVQAGGKYNLLPISCIHELNPQLSRPLQFDLQRPQMKSHPYLFGLNLLLRATGLTFTGGTGKKAKLIVDAEMLQRWQDLNPTEQYFALLKAWLLDSSDEMIGERPGWLDNNFSTCTSMWHQLPEEGWTFSRKQPNQAFLPGMAYRSFHHLALMDLFGLMEVDHFSKPIHPWIPKEIRHHPFGDAIFSALGSDTQSPDSQNDILKQLIARVLEKQSSEKEDDDGKFQKRFQPWFPDLQKTLEPPEEEPTREGVFVFRVSLGKVWREIAIVDDATLEHLAMAILKSVNFDNDHLYEFTWRDRRGVTVRTDHPYARDGNLSAAEVCVGDLPLKLKESMTFLFDFGDNWEFDVQLQEIKKRTAKSPMSRVIGKQGKAPAQYPNYDEWD